MESLIGRGSRDTDAVNNEVVVDKFVAVDAVEAVPVTVLCDCDCPIRDFSNQIEL